MCRVTYGAWSTEEPRVALGAPTRQVPGCRPGWPLALWMADWSWAAQGARSPCHLLPSLSEPNPLLCGVGRAGPVRAGGSSLTESASLRWSARGWQAGDHLCRPRGDLVPSELCPSFDMWQINIPSKVFGNEMTWVPLETLRSDHFNQDDACVLDGG